MTEKTEKEEKCVDEYENRKIDKKEESKKEEKIFFYFWIERVWWLKLESVGYYTDKVHNFFFASFVFIVYFPLFMGVKM